MCAQAPARPVAFAGSGQALGGGGAAAAAGPVQAATVTFSVNDSEPTTTIQIRLHDGTRIQQVFNHTHTVGDVYNWVSTATPNAQVKAPAASTLRPQMPWSLSQPEVPFDSHRKTAHTAQSTF